MIWSTDVSICGSGAAVKQCGFRRPCVVQIAAKAGGGLRGNTFDGFVKGVAPASITIDGNTYSASVVITYP